MKTRMVSASSGEKEIKNKKAKKIEVSNLLGITSKTRERKRLKLFTLIEGNINTMEG